MLLGAMLQPEKQQQAAMQQKQQQQLQSCGGSLAAPRCAAPEAPALEPARSRLLAAMPIKPLLWAGGGHSLCMTGQTGTLLCA